MNMHSGGRPIRRSNNGLGSTLLRISTIYLMIGLLMGLVMGITGDFALSSVHAHISLLGWATMAITAVVYLVVPACRASRLARWHFWSHNVGLPVMMCSLVLLTYGFQGAEKGLAFGSTLIVAALFVFSINVFLNCGQKQLNSTSVAGISYGTDPETAPSSEKVSTEG